MYRALEWGVDKVKGYAVWGSKGYMETRCTFHSILLEPKTAQKNKVYFSKKPNYLNVLIFHLGGN